MCIRIGVGLVGSVSLFFAKEFPNCEIVGLSNSNSQREWIMAQASTRGLKNLKIYTGNIVDFECDNYCTPLHITPSPVQLTI
eukprot:SAG11_NODE_1574_length_4659_cov_4.583333_4_plen_82_part_00